MADSYQQFLVVSLYVLTLLSSTDPTTTPTAPTDPTMPPITTTTTTTTTPAPDPTMPPITTTTTTTTTPAPDPTMPPITTTTTTTPTPAPDPTMPPTTTTTTTTTTTAPDPTMPPTTTTIVAPTTTTAAPTMAGPTTTAAPNYCNVDLTATATSQTFTFLNYDNNMNCYVKMTAPTATDAVLMTKITFVLEENTYCSYDKFAVYDGTSASATLIGEFCGTSIPATIQSSGQSMYVVFTSDYSTTFTGISMSYVSVDMSYPGCASGFTEYVATTTTQTISLASYSNLQDLYYLVTASGKGASDILVLNLTSVDIENANGCPYDRLTIYDGPCTNNGELHKVCGTRPYIWQLTGTSYLVHFHSDGSITKNGFSLDYFYSASFTTPSTTTTTTLGPPVAVEVNLMAEVLTNYTNDNTPRRDLSVPLSSTVDSYLVGINGLEEVSQKLTTTILFNYQWTDEQITWPVNKQGGVSKLLIPQDDIWKPDFALMNGFEKISQMGASFMFVSVQNTGLCTWKPYQILESVCKVDMTNFPFDTQTCDIKFSTWSSSASDVTVQVGNLGITKHESFVENSQWTLLEYKRLSETLQGKAVVVFRLTIKRNPSFVSFYITVPVVLLSFASAFTFAIPVDSGEKSGYGITVFLSFVVYLIVTFQKMPENSETLSLFAMYVLINTFMSGVAVIVVTIQVRLNGLSTRILGIPRIFVTFSKFMVKIQDKFMCISSQSDAKQFTNLDDEGNDAANDDADEQTGSWADFSAAINFVFFWVFLIISALMTMSIMGFLAFQ